MGTLRKELIVRQIAKDLYLREDVVEEVLDRFVDIAVEEIVAKGEFKVHRLLSVSTTDYKGYQAGKGAVPAHKRLRIRLSEGVHRLFKLTQANPSLEVTRDNWKTVLTTAPGAKKTERVALDNSGDGDLFNPLLDED